MATNTIRLAEDSDMLMSGPKNSSGTVATSCGSNTADVMMANVGRFGRRIISLNRFLPLFSSVACISSSHSTSISLSELVGLILLNAFKASSLKSCSIKYAGVSLTDNETRARTTTKIPKTPKGILHPQTKKYDPTKLAAEARVDPKI